MKNKNKDIVEKLVKQHSAMLVRFLMRRTKSREDAEDIAQAAFMRLYAHDNAKNLTNAKAYLFQVASNLSIDQLRRQSLHRSYLEGEMAKVPSEEGEGTGEEATLEREMEAKEKLSCVYTTLSKMPMNVRQAFILNRSKGMTYSAIADQMGVSVSSVEKYILEALKHLRKSLEQFENID